MICMPFKNANYNYYCSNINDNELKENVDDEDFIEDLNNNDIINIRKREFLRMYKNYKESSTGNLTNSQFMNHINSSYEDCEDFKREIDRGDQEVIVFDNIKRILQKIPKPTDVDGWIVKKNLVEEYFAVLKDLNFMGDIIINSKQQNIFNKFVREWNSHLDKQTTPNEWRELKLNTI